MVIYNMEGRFDSTFEEVDRQVQIIMARLTAQGEQWTAGFLFRLDFILRELFNNAIEHGNQMQPSKSVRYTLWIDRSDLEVCVGDEGEDFDIARELQQENQDDIFRVRRRGLATIAAMGFEITRQGGYTCVRLRGNPAGRTESEEAKVEISYRDDAVVCTVTTNLIGMNIRGLVEKMKAALAALNDYSELIIDLARIESVDSLGITFLIGTYKEALAQGKKVKLTGVSTAMFQLFKMMKLDEIFEVTTV